MNNWIRRSLSTAAVTAPVSKFSSWHRVKLQHGWSWRIDQPVLRRRWLGISGNHAIVRASNAAPIELTVWRVYRQLSARLGDVMPNTHRRRRRDETVESRRRCEVVNTPVGSRDSVYNFLCWQLTSDDIMTSLLKEIVKIHEYYTTQQIRMFTNMQRHMLRHILLL